MAAIYSNENIPLGLVVALRGLGHDILTSYDAGKANQRVTDEDVLRFATANNRCVLTLNRRDFRQLHRKTAGRHAGIITCTFDTDYAGQAQRIHTAIEGAGGIMSGIDLCVNRPC